MTRDELTARFTARPPKHGQAERFQAVRDAGREFATLVAALCPKSREQSLAVTRIEEAVFWANAGIARRG